MKYKEFVEWCSERTCDGCWSMNTAINCIEIRKNIDSKWPWNREKEWAKISEVVINRIVEPINQKIKEIREEQKWD